MKPYTDENVAINCDAMGRSAQSPPAGRRKRLSLLSAKAANRRLRPTAQDFQSHALRICLALAIAFTSLTLAHSASAAAMASKDTVQVQTPLSGAGVAAKETNLGNLIADAVRETGRAQAGFVPADEISGSASIPGGKAETSAIVSTLRYSDDPSDTVVVLNLTGAQLLKVAERSVSRAPQPFEGFLQVSGLQIRYNPGQPEGKRVSLVGAGGSEVEASKTYRVATTRPLSAGSLGYFQIWSQKDIAEDTGVSVAASLKAYLAAHKTVNSVVEDRITTH